MSVEPMNPLSSQLAINGGPPVRRAPLPFRNLFGESEFEAVRRVFSNAQERHQDFGFQSFEEEAYCNEFASYLGGGYADAVSSGSASIFVALRSLGLNQGDEVLLSPVNDPGTVSAAILLGLKPRLIDSSPNSYNVDRASFEQAITPNTKAAIVAHIGGLPIAAMADIQTLAKERRIRLIEDCSQSHGASIGNRKIGTFSDLAAFSTMYSKNHASGGCGGMIFTQNEELYWRVRQNADRGKPFHDPHLNPKDPTSFLGPALNFNQDELSCAIGRATLKKLEATIQRRIEIIRQIDSALLGSYVYRPSQLSSDLRPSPFFHTVYLDISQLSVSKREFCSALSAEGMTCNPDYAYVISEWPWARKHLPPGTKTPNASAYKLNSFNITFTEALSDADVGDIIAILKKVEGALRR